MTGRSHSSSLPSSGSSHLSVSVTGTLMQHMRIRRRTSDGRVREKTMMPDALIRRQIRISFLLYDSSDPHASFPGSWLHNNWNLNFFSLPSCPDFDLADFLPLLTRFSPAAVPARLFPGSPASIVVSFLFYYPRPRQLPRLVLILPHGSKQSLPE